MNTEERKEFRSKEPEDERPTSNIEWNSTNSFLLGEARKNLFFLCELCASSEAGEKTINLKRRTVNESRSQERVQQTNEPNQST